MSLTEDDLRHLARTATTRTSQAAWELLARLPWARCSQRTSWLYGFAAGSRQTDQRWRARIADALATDEPVVALRKALGMCPAGDDDVCGGQGPCDTCPKEPQA